MREVLPNILSWEWYSDEKGYYFNGYFLDLGKEKVIIDPPPMTPGEQEQILRMGPPTCILITNRDHVREANNLRNRYSCKIWIHELDAPLIDIGADRTFQDGDRLPGALVAVHVPDNKSPGETAFLLERDNGILFLGDALIGNPAGQLNLMKPEKYADPAKARKGIRVLLGYNFDLVLVGDGVSVTIGGKQAVEEFMKRKINEEVVGSDEVSLK